MSTWQFCTCPEQDCDAIAEVLQKIVMEDQRLYLTICTAGHMKAAPEVNVLPEGRRP